MKIAMPELLRVRDVMTENVFYLHANLPSETAWAALRKRGISAAPVVDSHGAIKGVLSLTDLADPRHHDPEAVVTVDQLMTRVIYAVKKDDPVSNAVRLMRDEAIHRVFVVDDAGELVGVVVPMDILRALRLDDTHRSEYVDLRTMHRGA